MVEHLNLQPEKSQESLTILEWSSILQGNIWSGHSTLRRHPGGVEYLRGLWSQLRCLKKTISGARLTYEELLTVIIEVEMILNCRPLSYVSSEDYEEPLSPSHLLCGHRIMSLPDNRSSEAEDSDTDVQPQDLDRRMRHLSNVMNHFWKRWRKDIYSNYETHIVMLLSTPLTESYPLETWLLFMTKTSREENSALERLKLLSRDQMVTSEELLFELKLRQEDSLDSDLQYNAFTP